MQIFSETIDNMKPPQEIISYIQSLELVPYQ